jgi:hypothetical protein
MDILLDVMTFIRWLKVEPVDPIPVEENKETSLRGSQR